MAPRPGGYRRWSPRYVARWSDGAVAGPRSLTAKYLRGDLRIAVPARRRRGNGLVSGLYLVGYAFGRFWLEQLRGDARQRWQGLSVAQLLSLAFLLAGAGLLLSYRLHRDTSAADAGKR